jgi:hypothetical protein
MEVRQVTLIQQSTLGLPTVESIVLVALSNTNLVFSKVKVGIALSRLLNNK